MSGLPTIVHASQAPGGQQCFTQLVHAHQNGLRTELWRCKSRTVSLMVECYVDTLGACFGQLALLASWRCVSH